MMQNASSKPAGGEPTGLYLLAGVGTAPRFMEGFHDELAGLLRREGHGEVCGGLLFPYGDWSRPMRRQLVEVWHDIRLPPHRLGASIGGQAARREAEAKGWCPGRSGRMVLIGHSGGGTAALHWGWRLVEEGLSVSQLLVVQIGSPKSPVPEKLQPCTAYCYSVRPDGAGKDPVCRLGSWSFSRGMPGWGRNRRLGSPGTLLPLPLAGGHPDYFRRGMTSGNGSSNLETTLGAVWEFIKG